MDPKAFFLIAFFPYSPCLLSFRFSGLNKGFLVKFLVFFKVDFWVLWSGAFWIIYVALSLLE